MSRRKVTPALVWGALCIALALSGCAAKTTEKARVAEDSAQRDLALRQVVMEYYDAVNAYDVGRILSFFTNDAMIMTFVDNERPEMAPKAEYAASLPQKNAGMRDYKMRCEPTVQRIAMSGEEAAVTVSLHLSTPDGYSKTLVEELVFRPHDDQWRIARKTFDMGGPGAQ